MPVEAVGADGAHPALGVSVRVGRPYRRPDHPDALGAEDLVERARELAVAVMDEEPEPLLLADLHYQVAGLLWSAPVLVEPPRDPGPISRRALA